MHTSNIIHIIGTMLIIAASTVTVPKAEAQEYFAPLSMEGVELYSSLTFGHIDEFTILPSGLYRLDADNNYAVETSHAFINDDIAGGCTYHNGKIYANVFNDDGYVQMAKPKWTVYDANTFEVISSTELPDNCAATTRSLAYDPVSDKIYGLNYTYTETYLVEIDPATGAMRRIGDKLDPKMKFYSLACNRNGILYCLYLGEDSATGDQTHYLAKVQKSTGRMALIGAIKAKNLLPGDQLLNMKYKQAMFFDNSQNKLYWILPSSSMALDNEYTAILEINPLNAQGTLVAYLRKLYHISGAFLKEPASTAPAVISDFSCEPESVGSTNVKLRFTLPSTDYQGKPLGKDELTVIVEENGKELVRGHGAPGSEFLSDYITLTNENHTVGIHVENADGAGPVVKRSFYVGYDLPDICRNISLSADGLTTTLTWDAPDAGQNGAPINSEALTYNVVRWPDETIVAEGIKERVYKETHPAEMTRYAYSVFAVDGSREGKRASSNQIVVGLPLDLPYGGIFKTYNDMYNYYTILDENNDRITWSYDRNTASAYYGYSMYRDADDWLISPPINYKGGQEYLLKFKAYSSLESYPESMRVTFGADRTAVGQDRLLLDIPVVPAVDEDHPVTQYEVPFTVDTDGVYYYGFHANTERYHEFLFIFDIKIDRSTSSSVINVSGADCDPVTVKAGRCTIFISNPTGNEVCIYDVNGSLVARSAATNAEIDMQPGIYIVHTGKYVRKVAVF